MPAMPAQQHASDNVQLTIIKNIAQTMYSSKLIKRKSLVDIRASSAVK